MQLFFVPAHRVDGAASLLLRRLMLALILLAMVLPGIVLAQDGQSRRIALVIGNGAYQNAPELSNPGNDAEDLAAALKNVGFEVIHRTDQTQGQLLDTLRTFQRKSSGADIALIYYAGHGIEIDRQNYLIPVDAVLETDSDVNFETVTLETVMFAASGATQLSMVIVDACRNNPFATSMQRSASSRSIGRGLSAVEPAQNTLVAYAAKEGTTAADGIGRNSPYAAALLKALARPDLEVGLMMRQVRDEVLGATNGQQEPFVYGSLSAEQIFLNEARGLSIVAPEGTSTSGPTADAAEIAYWQSISQGSNVDELETYLTLYPSGLFSNLARSRIARMRSVASLSGSESDVTDQNSGLSSERTQPAVGEQTVSPAPQIQQLTNRNLTRIETVELQERLSAAGHSLGRADGIAGRRTISAIRKFEEEEGLEITGAATWRVLQRLRSRVDDVALADWREEQTKQAAVPTSKPVQQIIAPTKPTPTPKQSTAEPVATSPSKGSSQFCRSNRQCETSECRAGAGTSNWRNRPSCSLCSIYVDKCL